MADTEAFSINEAAKSIINDKKLLQGTTTKVPMPQLTKMMRPIPSQQRKVMGDHYLREVFMNKYRGDEDGSSAEGYSEDGFSLTDNFMSCIRS